MKFLPLTLVCAALSACGGGGGERQSGGDGVVPDYVSLDDGSTPTTSSLKGVYLSSSDGVVVADGGSLRHSTRVLSNLDIDGTVLNAPSDGGAGVWTASDGANTVTISELDELGSGSYNFVRLYEVESSDIELNGTLILGVATDPGDLPETGGATYTGLSGISYTLTAASGSITGSQNGLSTVDVDFVSGEVDVSLTFASGDISSVTISDMDIVGNGFSGGSFALDTDPAVELSGDLSTIDAAGVFFGIDGAIPDEVGGGFQAEGTSGNISGLFIAD